MFLEENMKRRAGADVFRISCTFWLRNSIFTCFLKKTMKNIYLK